jgi:aspartate racemase
VAPPVASVQIGWRNTAEVKMNERKKVVRPAGTARTRRERVVGVLGGLGPGATVNFFGKLIAKTDARRDPDHLRILIDNNPKIPDRNKAIAGTGPSPVPELVRSARALQRAGADFIVIPCVTVHVFHEALQARTRVKVLNIVDEIVAAMRRRRPAIRRLGLIATNSTVRAGLFQEAFARTRIELLIPPDEVLTDQVMKAIYAIKATGPGDEPRRLVREVCEALVARGAEAILAGCTEIPLVLSDGDLAVPVADALTILAESTIRYAGCRVRKV